MYLLITFIINNFLTCLFLSTHIVYGEESVSYIDIEYNGDTVAKRYLHTGNYDRILPEQKQVLIVDSSRDGSKIDLSSPIVKASSMSYQNQTGISTKSKSSNENSSISNKSESTKSSGGSSTSYKQSYSNTFSPTSSPTLYPCTTGWTCICDGNTGLGTQSSIRVNSKPNQTTYTSQSQDSKSDANHNYTDEYNHVHSNSEHRMSASLQSSKTISRKDHTHPNMMAHLHDTELSNGHYTKNIWVGSGIHATLCSCYCDLPSELPTKIPTTLPSSNPSAYPSFAPTNDPSISPSSKPSYLPSTLPSKQPSSIPSYRPSQFPTNATPKLQNSMPTPKPTPSISRIPSLRPSPSPTLPPIPKVPTIVFEPMPGVIASSSPSFIPTNAPSLKPSLLPSVVSPKVALSSPTIAPSCTNESTRHLKSHIVTRRKLHSSSKSVSSDSDLSPPPDYDPNHTKCSWICASIEYNTHDHYSSNTAKESNSGGSSTISSKSGNSRKSGETNMSTIKTSRSTKSRRSNSNVDSHLHYGDIVPTSTVVASPPVLHDIEGTLEYGSPHTHYTSAITKTTPSLSDISKSNSHSHKSTSSGKNIDGTLLQCIWTCEPKCASPTIASTSYSKSTSHTSKRYSSSSSKLDNGSISSNSSSSSKSNSSSGISSSTASIVSNNYPSSSKSNETVASNRNKVTIENGTIIDSVTNIKSNTGTQPKQQQYGQSSSSSSSLHEYSSDHLYMLSAQKQNIEEQSGNKIKSNLAQTEQSSYRYTNKKLYYTNALVFASVYLLF